MVSLDEEYGSMQRGFVSRGHTLGELQERIVCTPNTKISRGVERVQCSDKQ